ncbi:Werner Syndrome-like exonuclease [Vitis vinifera]|uniref:Werner Syndrome-like exonuclease n=1 Tax=Vitis vinifera TaxID=29760 RepID=A0A438CKT6_VITVI|nr:Werner Syndrome-like exonuclease [Vitis vinifera]
MLFSAPTLSPLPCDHTSARIVPTCIPAAALVGVGIANDAVKVFKDHSVSVKDLEDLSYLANQKLGGDAKKWGLGSLTEMLISKQVNSMLILPTSL